MPTSLLLAEDDPRLRHDLERHFLNRGFVVQACATGTQALDALQRADFGLVLLDILLPGIDGLSLLDALRKRQAVPVMLMSALGAEQDRISGFTRGADDYLPKPFSLAELDARVDALLRRVAFDRRPVFSGDAGEVRLDHERQDVLYEGRAAGLTASEFRLLATLPAQLRERLDREVADMQRLLENTLDLAWMDTEQPSLPTEPLLVLSLWEALCEDICFESGWPRTRLPCSLGIDCRVQAQLDSLAQALENLLRNAIRHSPAGGEVRLDGWREGGCWHLRLSDQGPGVPDSELERIFQPYQRLAGSGAGFGLGLAIARRAVELQGGRLWASNAQPGLCLHLLLPVAADGLEG